MSPLTFSIGPYELIRPLGRGGMAEVWLGRHKTSGVSVAIKIFTGRGTRSPRFRSAFRNEARALAALEHPNIAAVYDFGEIAGVVAERTDGRLRVGEPFLVMELAGGGAITPLVGQLTWQELRWVLLEVLDALAHAHARGVIHRDLKPDNVLVGTGAPPGDERPALLGASLLDLASDPYLMAVPSGALGIKLSDFGLAVAIDPSAPGRNTEAAGAAGTPAYMAPEQIAGAWRDYGPWTDLYSLGCLAWALASGRPPFAGLSISQQVEAHQRALPPPLSLAGLCDAPHGFEQWLLRLLAKAPSDRYRWASDAGAALRKLGDSGPFSPEAQAASVAERLRLARATAEPPPLTATLHLSEVSLASATWAELGELRERELPEPAEVVAPRSALWSSDLTQPPPPPTKWRRAEGLPTSGPMLGVSLALFGLRTVPMVDRDMERDHLWSLLCQTVSTSRPHAVLLQGPSGCGKSRLARWLCERAHELGSARWLRSVYGPTSGMTGLGAMIGRFLRCGELDRPGVIARVSELLSAQGMNDDDEVAALTELIAPGADGGRVVRFERMEERTVLAARFLARLSRERPVVVWLDDVQWGLEALSLIELMIGRVDELRAPVLLVATVQDEALSERPLEAACLERLVRVPGVTRLAVGPLPATHRLTLVHEILGLEGNLAADVAMRTGGNALFAVQLVGDWVARGLLVPSEGGFRLRPGVTAGLPDDLHAVWDARVARLLGGRPGSEAMALELAAVLGLQVETAEWGEVCRLSGGEMPLGLLDALLDERLATSEEGDPLVRWTFAHGMLVESILRRAADGGRLAQHHRVCAAMLHARVPERPSLLRVAPASLDEWLAARLGRHLLAAGDLEAALNPLLQGAWERGLVGDLAQAEALLGERERAMADGGVAESDSRWGEGWLLRAWFEARSDDPTRSERLLERVEVAARRWGWERVLAQGLYEAAWLCQDRGETELARVRLLESSALADKLHEPMLRASCDRYLCRLMMKIGMMEEADRHGEAALELFQQMGDRLGAAGVLLLMSDVANWAGKPELAAERTAAANECFEAYGSRWGMAQAANTLGEIARMRGRPEEAVGHYRVSLSRYQAVGSVMAIIPYVNMGLLAVETGDYGRARPILERSLGVLERQGLRPFACATHLALLAPAAAAKDWDAFDQHFTIAVVLLTETGAVDVDNARMASRAAEEALRGGETRRAARALRVAYDQWHALGREDEATQTAAALAEIE